MIGRAVAEMGEQMQGVEGDTGWRKAIPEARDRLQSKWLVGVVGALLLWETVAAVRQVHLLWGTYHDGEPVLLAEIVGISIAFAYLVLALRAATLGGAFVGGMICLNLLYDTSAPRYTVVRSGLAPLVLLFVLTFLSTRAGRRKKARAGLAEDRRGRSAAQVTANLATAALSISLPGYFFVMSWKVCCGPLLYRWVYPAMAMMCLAALVEATADTVSSEIGQAFGGTPVMLLGLRRVDIGTDGAVTLLGSGAGVVAGALVAVVGTWALRLGILEGAVAGFAGVCGLFFDSLLGATVERRGWLGNDLVNFTSTVFAAVLAAAVYRLLLH
jgi:uncharacterized protein (TIGR00297 family)